METWQVYGIDGELLAEYAAGAYPFLPRKEYGYRNGQLLVTVANGDEDRRLWIGPLTRRRYLHHLNRALSLLANNETKVVR